MQGDTHKPFAPSLSKGVFRGTCFDFAQHERGGFLHRLICHSDTPAAAVSFVGVKLSPGRLVFSVEGGALKIPPPASPVRTDGLWRTTCFEMFVKPVGQAGYRELNFAPSTAWAAYAFDGYRAGMTDLWCEPPMIAWGGSTLQVTFDATVLTGTAVTVALSVVIEETDGTKSYWALRHPPGPPDFHHPDCFALRIPALG